jgi:hypothetical protein
VRLVDVEAGRRSLRSLVWLLPVFVVWENCHGGVLAGLGTLGLIALGWCLCFLLGGRDCPIRSRRDVLFVGVLVAASLLGLLLNPYGLGMPQTWAKILALPLGHLIQEHAPLDLRQPFGLLTAMLGAGYLTALAGVWPRRPRITWLMPLVWFVLAAQRVRNTPLAAIVTVIALADLLPHTRWTGWLAGHGMFKWRVASGQWRVAREPEAGGLLGRIAAPATAVFLAVAVQLGGLHLPLLGQGWVQLDSSHWPVALLPELRAIERGAPATGTRIFNDMLFGGFLTFYTPRLQIFIDDRCEHYGRDFLLAYDHGRREDPGQLDAWRRQYHFDFALVASGSPLDCYLNASGGWSLVRRSGPAALWRLRD